MKTGHRRILWAALVLAGAVPADAVFAATLPCRASDESGTPLPSGEKGLGQGCRKAKAASDAGSKEGDRASQLKRKYYDELGLDADGAAEISPPGWIKRRTIGSNEAGALLAGAQALSCVLHRRSGIAKLEVRGGNATASENCAADRCRSARSISAEGKRLLAGMKADAGDADMVEAIRDRVAQERFAQNPDRAAIVQLGGWSHFAWRQAIEDLDTRRMLDELSNERPGAGCDSSCGISDEVWRGLRDLRDGDACNGAPAPERPALVRVQMLPGQHLSLELRGDHGIAPEKSCVNKKKDEPLCAELTALSRHTTRVDLHANGKTPGPITLQLSSAATGVHLIKAEVGEDVDDEQICRILRRSLEKATHSDSAEAKAKAEERFRLTEDCAGWSPIQAGAPQRGPSRAGARK